VVKIKTVYVVFLISFKATLCNSFNLFLAKNTLFVQKYMCSLMYIYFVQVIKYSRECIL